MSIMNAFIWGRSLFGDNVTSFGLLKLGERFVFASLVITEPRPAFTKIGPRRFTDGKRTFTTGRKTAVISLAE